ncbi:esterase-like activity of phytase family protein [Sphingosinicella sp. CPCC 101087]|uniref:esterase-like activity of phytase family protein n=1 Tax=Sphingosinicella sp. CPCC 101087 TaxID=2497754 RepID=UPI00101E0945|nr:esterase-like activity of phytase family protein [Sphingosinicella sp. CPCC 101087]
MKLARILNGRKARFIVLPPILLLLATFVPRSPPPPFAAAADTLMTAVPVALDPDRPHLRRVGALTFLRGWALRSDDRRFGGLSAMQVEGSRVTAITDVGVVLSFGLPLRAGTQPLRVEPLSRRDIPDKELHDTESLVISGGRAWIGFERINAVARYDRDGWRLESASRPPAMRRWRANLGAEAMVRLPDGRFLIFAEAGAKGDALSPILLFAGDPADRGTPAERLLFRRRPGYRVTDAALLPDGRLLTLERRFGFLEGASARLAVAEIEGLGAGSIVDGRTIAELAAPLTVDNMEALSVTREGGLTIVRIASDDNFIALQRTLLLEFALDVPERAPNPSEGAGTLRRVVP